MSRSLPRRARVLSAIGVAFVIPVALVQPATQADATHPFDVFADCPAEQMVADGAGADSSCITAVVTGGEFVIGKGTVPVTAESRLSLGSAFIGGAERDYGVPGRVFVSSPMQVPGGLLGVPRLERLLPGLTDITATVQLATDEIPKVDVLSAIYGGHVVTLPIKIRLKNALLGPRCYIGSDADPIVLRLTTGPTDPPAPNEPISGKTGTFSFVPVETGGSVVESTGGILVDNSFSVPKAHGCGPGGILDSVVNQRQGLPSPAGTNTAILHQDAYLGGPAPDVLAHQQG